MVVDEIILQVKGDLKDIKKRLKELDGKPAEEAGKNAGESFSDGFGKVVAAFAANKLLKGITNFFGKATELAGKTELALKGVTSSANAFNQSASSATQAAKELTEDGFLTLEQSATAVKNLLATGLSVDQTKKFIAASKNITAFQNTIGDASQAVTDLSTGLLRGSALVIDNASPSLRKLSGEYQKVLKEQGKAAAAQLAYNEVIKQGAQFAGDAEKSLEGYLGATKRLQAAQREAFDEIGNQIREVLAPYVETVAGATKSFGDFFTNLEGGSKTILLVSTLLLGLTVAIGTAIPAIKAMSFALGAAAGPIAIALAAITAITTALVIFNETLGESTETRVKDFQQTEKDLAQAKEVEKVTLKSTEDKKQLAEINKRLSDSAEALGISLSKENGELKTNAELAADVLAKKRGLLELELANLNKRSAIQSQQIELLKRSVGLEGRRNEEAAKLNRAVKNEVEQLAEINAAALAAKNALDGFDASQRKVNSSVRSFNRTAKDVKSFGFTEAREELAELSSEFSKFKQEQLRLIDREIAALRERGGTLEEEKELADKLIKERKNAQDDFEFREEQIRIRLRRSFAEFIEDERTARILSINEATNEAMANLNREKQARLAEGKDRIKIERRFQREKTKIEKAARIKRLKADLDTAKKELDFIGQGFAGVGGLFADSLSGQISGAGGLLSGVGGFVGGAAGAAIGGVGSLLGPIGGIVGTLEDLFGDDSAERMAEQERRHREAQALRQAQIDLAKKQIELQIKNNDLNDTLNERQIRLNELTAEQTKLSLTGELVAGELTQEEFDVKLAESDANLIKDNLVIIADAIGINTDQAKKLVADVAGIEGAEPQAIRDFAASFGIDIAEFFNPES
ncbi:MAG: coiled-coil domain-containing protein, partial [Planctomycetota bacterium]